MTATPTADQRCNISARTCPTPAAADEIYAASIHDAVAEEEPDSAARRGRSVFTSIVELCAEDAPPAPALPDGAAAAPSPPSFLGSDVHVVWGLSKDWAASGLRVGFLYTHNEQLLAALSNVNYFTSVSNHTQDALAGVLEDAPWADAYLRGCVGALRDAAGVVRAGVEGARGVRLALAPQAGMFAWLDLRALLLPPPPGGDGWAAEEALTEDLLAHARVLFTPGGACHAPQPGYYRCCFAWMGTDAVAVAFARLREFAERRLRGEV